MCYMVVQLMQLYPVHCVKLTVIQPLWSAYPYHLVFLIWYPFPFFSLYGIHMPLFPYMVIQPIALGMALLWAAMDSLLSQGPLLWHHNDMCKRAFFRVSSRRMNTLSIHRGLFQYKSNGGIIHNTHTITRLPQRIRLYSLVSWQRHSPSFTRSSHTLSFA